MSLYILDTDHITLHQHNHPQVSAQIQKQAREQIVTTAVTMEEQMRGRLAQIAQNKGNLSMAYELLCSTAIYFCDLIILPFDNDAQQQYQKLRSRKIRIGTLDLRIAAIALSQNAILVTRNHRDFSQIPELQFEDWSQ
ncbi:MAG: type II toxin-antitoxin system VapC family toxin [Caldilineaceae bacterium]